LERDAKQIYASYRADPEFRTDVDALVSREAVDACVVDGVLERAPISSIHYHGFIDPSGGSADSMTAAVAHREDETIILDAVREVKPPFSPELVSKEFASFFKSYRCSTIRGDRFAGEWPREQFRKHGVEYAVADKTRSEIYLELLPLINSRRVALLDHQRLVTQLVGLERKTSRAGKDSIDHAQGGHDDVINAAAGAIVNAAKVVRDHEISFHAPDLSYGGVRGELRRHFGDYSSFTPDFSNRQRFS
jgi:hypothetical protein